MIHPPKQDESQNHTRGNPYDSGFRRDALEHEFDSTVITLVDEGSAPLQEDVVINAFEECVTIKQFDARTDRMQKITLSMAQLAELGAALNLPEGVYSRMRELP